MRRSEHNALRTRIDGRHCVYCGEQPTTDEHFPPVCNGVGGYILPACSECNGLSLEPPGRETSGGARNT